MDPTFLTKKPDEETYYVIDMNYIHVNFKTTFKQNPF